MFETNATYCFVDFFEHTNELRFRLFAPRPGGILIKMEPKSISKKEIDDACKKYWQFVNDHIENGVVTGADEKRRRAFFDNLMTQGSRLREQLMDNSTALKLWNIARTSDILVIITGLLHVPWEALFNPMSEVKGFLSDCCVVTRWPESPDESGLRIDKPLENFETQRLTCVDPMLIDKVHLDTIPIEKALASDGEDVYITEDKGGLVKKVERVRVVHWICEHHDDGLRLSSESFYTVDDGPVHRFAPGTVLVLTSCKGGANSSACPGIAASICSSSKCTVVAPSSVVAAEAGARFAQRINVRLKASTERMTLAELWRSIREPLRNYDHTRPIPPESCFTLWYGIYGNGDAFVRG